MPLNKHRSTTIKLENSHRARRKFQKTINAGPLIRSSGLEKNPKLMNVGPTFFSESRVRVGTDPR